MTEGLRSSISRKIEFDLDELSSTKNEEKRYPKQSMLGRAEGSNNETSQLPKGSPEFLAKVTEMKELASKVKDLEGIAKKADDAFKEAFMTVPNILRICTDGKGEEDNQTISTWEISRVTFQMQ